MGCTRLRDGVYSVQHPGELPDGAECAEHPELPRGGLIRLPRQCRQPSSYSHQRLRFDSLQLRARCIYQSLASTGSSPLCCVIQFSTGADQVGGIVAELLPQLLPFNEPNGPDIAPDRMIPPQMA